jgi:hypothetical protein
MHSKILAALAGVSFVLASFGAQAMPAATVDGGNAAPQITLAAEGCGPGFALSPAGICRRIGRRAVVVAPVRRALVVAPRRGLRARCGVRVGPIGVRTAC